MLPALSHRAGFAAALGVTWLRPTAAPAALAAEPGLRPSLGAAGESAILAPAATPSTWIAWLLAALTIAGALVLLSRARRALSASEARFRQLCEQGSDVVLRIEGVRRSASRSVVDLLGYTAEEMASLDWERLIHPEDRDEVMALWRATPERTTRALAYRLTRKDGGVVFVEAHAYRVMQGRALETIVTLRDVTARREEESGLRRAMAAAQAAEAAAAEASRAKGEFLASMSHEIRTPLNAIIGFADLIITDSSLPPGARRHAERVKAGGDALLTVVNDILDFSQIEAGALRLDPRPFALPLLVDECIALVEGAARARNLALHVTIDGQVPAGVIGDETRLRQVLLNLVNNAIKFTHAGAVTLRIRREPSGRTLFEVEDTGIGIARENLPHLFERFHQVDGSIRRTYGGTGLGLAISKMLVEGMGGDIGVRSEAGQGSTFYFSLDLPAVRLRLEAAKETAARPRPARRLHILLVEDVRLNQELVLAVLDAAGHTVDVVGDGAEAIMAVEHRAYDLVLMDVQMPGIDGLSATRAIRALPLHGRLVPIVALSANVLPAQVEAAMASGMDDFIPKPLTLEAALAVLERAERGAIRAVSDATSHDAATLQGLAAIVGEAKVRGMLGTLETTLLGRFTATPDPSSQAALKAEAHAAIAGSAMLGFKAFAGLCRRLIEAEGDVEFGLRHDALLRELGRVVRHSGALARGEAASDRRAA